MTYDLLNVFKKYFEEDKVILDSYELTDGYYYVIENDGNFEKMQVVNNNSDNYELEKYIKVRDFYSKYINSNKALDTNYIEEINNVKYTMLKKICSNNIYTLFFKNKSVLGLCNKEVTKDAVPVDVFKKGIDKYYESLLKLGNDKKEEKLVKEKYKEEEIKISKEKILKAFDIVCKDLENENMPKETWIKILLKEDVEEYKADYKELIIRLQELIREATSLSATIQAQESRNKVRVDIKFRQLKDNAKTAKRSVSMANKYYQNMSRVSSEPQFMDQKK